MRPRRVVMPNEVAEHVPQVPLVDHDDVVCGTNMRSGVRPRAGRRDATLPAPAP